MECAVGPDIPDATLISKERRAHQIDMKERREPRFHHTVGASRV